jgi:putative transposase
MPTKTDLLKSTGEYFHVFDRGVNREQIFFRPEDYAFFVKLVPESMNGIDITLHGYGLMPNHYHFELRQNEPYGMSRFFQRLNFKYALTTNALYGRVGHLFQGDYTPKLIKKPELIPWLNRYIDRNPVKAGLVKKATDWEFSSARELCGIQKAKFIDTSLVWGLVGGPEAYRDFLEGDSDDTPDDLDGLMFLE